MALTTRFLRTSRPSHHAISSSSSSSSSLSARTTVRCVSKAGFNGDKRVSGNGDTRKSTVPVKASVATSNSLMITKKPVVDGGIDLATLLANVTNAMLVVSRTLVRRRPWRLPIQMFIERVIINCRFFTLFAVAGSLLGSVLCFVEGCFLCGKSYFQFFYTLSHKADQAHIMHLLIEAMDTFLVGTAMLIFGVGLYTMFVGSRKGPWLPSSNLFGLFALKKLPKWVEMESVSQAKSRIGYAVMMILQVGVLEKFNNIRMVTSLDLACFAGAVLISSACIFLLSRLSFGTSVED
ncbi:hypothetical protein ACOSP7_010837 [Xanthoceras sorbifolium]|uniref:Uncharacterized protein n=1 Tax=Xanthoceras sorbifolium TaxID=99658 RepID=A0ABQ8HSK3_9ROSI|nr:hypothetical protein JRO89_XS07G0053300 [Xanthoceras sorbifolium]